MASLLIVVAVAVIATIWIRGVRSNRLVWLQKLNLPGRWRCEQGELAFEGDLNGGRYRVTEGARDETGRWLLEGDDLLLIADTAADCKRHQLRLFAPGKIGVDGPGLPRRVYDRVPDNIVPLRVKGR